MANKQLTPEQNERRLRNATKNELVYELYNLDYTGSKNNDGSFTFIDEMDEDNLFDTLMGIYEVYPDKIPDSL